MAGDPTAAVEAVTYDGETVVDAIALAGGTVGVTSHRVIVFDEGTDPPSVTEAPRASVAGVEARHVAAGRDGPRALRVAVVAAALLLGSHFLQFEGLRSIEPPTAAVGPEGLLGLALATIEVLPLVDDVLRVAGLGCLVVALALALRYWRRRKRQMVVTLAGREPLVLPLHPSEEDAVDRVRAAVEKASNPTAG